MFQRSNLAPALPAPNLGLRFNAAFFTGLLLALLLVLTLLMSGCKSATTPTQTQTPAQPQTPTAEPQTQQSSYPVTDSPISARSDAEVIADLDGELDASIAVFDGMILDERARAEAIEASLGGPQAGEEAGDSDGGAGGAADLFEDGDIYEGLPGYGEFPEDPETQQANSEGEGSGEGTAASDDGSDNEAIDAGDLASNSGLDTTRPGGIPEDIESGSDDDIVARQIREAALKEKDPVLREKLWDEYRKYKNQ